MIRLLYILVLVMLTESALSQKVVIGFGKKSVLYTCIANQFTVAAEGIDCSKLLLTTDNGKISRKSGCHYEIRPAHSGTALITVNEKTKNGSKTIARQTFSVTHYKLQDLEIGSSSGGPLRKAELINSPAPRALWSCHNLEMPFVPVIGFTVIVQRRGAEVFRHTNTSDGVDLKIDSLTFDFFNYELVDSDKVLFTDVRAKTCEPVPASFRPLEFIITDAGHGPFKRPACLPGFDTLIIINPTSGDTELHIRRRIAH